MGATTEPRVLAACSFCMKSAASVARLVAGPGVFICNECVGLCCEVIDSVENHEPVSAGVASWEQRLTDEELLNHLPRVAALAAQVEQQLTAWVRQARQRGITWTRIGESLGMTRQSAWERFSGED